MHTRSCDSVERSRARRDLRHYFGICALVFFQPPPRCLAVPAGPAIAGAPAPHEHCARRATFGCDQRWQASNRMHDPRFQLLVTCRASAMATVRDNRCAVQRGRTTQYYVNIGCVAGSQ
eukprot:219642-Pyramimonas_sp.AAC.1